ncbi:MAG: hypothetical protein O3C34_02420 [Proteobacteria bacterium]|nr:hypothetical protein [Pseudomonadota bacterium]
MTENWKDDVEEFEAFEFPPDPADDFDWAPATQVVAGNLPDLPLEAWQNQGASRRGRRTGRGADQGFSQSVFQRY